MKIIGFDWDDGNEGKCEKHGISVKEIEGFFYGGKFRVAPDIKHSAIEKRLFAVGLGMNGKPIYVVFVEREGLIRPVSARYMHKKEWKRYEEKNPAF
jgi:uncharacterized DUF497 family protein